MNKCKNLINAAHAANPAAFNNVDQVLFVILKVRPVRDAADIMLDPDQLLLIDNYNQVGLRTDNETNTLVVGIKGDGVVTYPYPWCVNNVTDPAGYYCHMIGSWDCYDEVAGTGLTVEQCCSTIQASTFEIGSLDVHGNELECYNSPPPHANVEDPPDYGRVFLHVNAQNQVVHPPMTG